jgi:hypothetical protein
MNITARLVFETLDELKSKLVTITFSSFQSFQLDLH